MSREPFNDAELRFIEERAERGVDTPSMTARFLIADLRAAHAEIDRLTERAVELHSGFKADAAQWRAQEARARAAESARDAAQARADAAEAHIGDLRRLLNDAKAERSEQQDRAKRAEGRLTAAEARLAEVIAICERTYGAAVGYRDLVIKASEVRAAAMGTEPEADS